VSSVDKVVKDMIAEHVRLYPPVEVEMIDITSGEPVRRLVPLLITTRQGNPLTDRTWSRERVGWRDAARWPKEHGGFHALRHFFATTLITWEACFRLRRHVDERGGKINADLYRRCTQ
jgi:integrase